MAFLLARHQRVRPASLAVSFNPIAADLQRIVQSNNATPMRLGQVHGGARSLTLAALAPLAQPLLVVTADSRQAEQVAVELEFFSPGLVPDLFPDYETLPYDMFSPHRELIARRLSVLWNLIQGVNRPVVLAAESLLTRLPPVDFVLANALLVSSGDRMDRDRLRSALAGQGYIHVDQVMEPGEFAVRGSLIDLFPAGALAPVRLDFFDDEIDGIRTFDPHTQRSKDKLDSIRVLPARDFPTDEAAIQAFRSRFRDRFEGNPNEALPYKEVSAGRLPGGIEYYLPLFFDATADLFDYLPSHTRIVLMDQSSDDLEGYWEAIRSRYDQLRGDRERPLLQPEEAFVKPETVTTKLAAFAPISLSRTKCPRPGPQAHNLETEHALGLVVADGTGIKLPQTETMERTLIAAESRGRREILQAMLRDRGVSTRVIDSWADFATTTGVAITVAALSEGFALPKAGIAVIAEAELVPDRPRQQRRRRHQVDPQAIIRELNDLKTRAPVVHEEYGIGRYLGLNTLTVDGLVTEFLTLEYAGGDKLYVPVQNLHLISRYTGASEETAPLHRLGSDQWARAKKRAAERIRDVAAELLNVYARRAAREGVAFSLDEDAYQRFCLEFPFQETEDQTTAIDQIVADMVAPRPMDRLVCGDVGFGKTEVALRAAFVAVHGGHQVALLVPTTLLARQHYQTFTDRFADWPVNVKLLSRFTQGRASEETLHGLANGTVDIVIGTHKLLQSNIDFKTLGLVIVDEEHRFGVRHKERLKSLRADVDMLTLTATPIPRTLNMTLGGLRDLSLIATPPAERLAVRTFVSQHNDGLIRDAVLRELHRGGQTYFVHNKVEDIEKVAARLRELLPEASIQVAHGQMSERQIEPVMLDFYHRRFDVLVCTTIIESGIDVPSANTIIINRADRFGLAQLHQLRGRVGRSHHQAYAYLITPPPQSITPDATKRLEAIEALEDLGAGFTLATHDLEIRGAGELLGDEQSGQIQEIGFALYSELLDRAVEALKSGEEPDMENPLQAGTEINLGLPALIPNDYMPDVHMRLVHYKRIASAASQAEIRDLMVEFIDRFGLLPDPVRNLFRVTEAKLKAVDLGILKVEAGSGGGFLKFAPAPNIDTLELVKMVESEPTTFRLDGNVKLRFSWETQTAEARFAALEQLLDRLRPDDGASAAA